MAAVARRYRRFAVLSTPANFLNTIGLEAPLLLLVALYGASVGGQYALAARIAGLPVALVASGISQWFTARAAHRLRTSGQAPMDLFWRATLRLALGTAIPFVAFGVAAYLLAPAIFGETWREAGTYILILTPMYFLQLVMSSTGSALDVLERQGLNLTREIIRVPLIGLPVAAVAAAGLEAVYGVIVVSISGCILYLLYGWITWIAIRTAPEYERHGRAS